MLFTAAILLRVSLMLPLYRLSAVLCVNTCDSLKVILALERHNAECCAFVVCLLKAHRKGSLAFAEYRNTAT